MAVREILRMGDPRLLRIAKPVLEFDTDALHMLVSDMLDTMRAANGAGLAAPQIGVDLQLVIFGTGTVSPRYPDAPPIPFTVLCNPVITPLGEAMEDGWEGCLSVPGLRGLVPRFASLHYKGLDQYGDAVERSVSGFHARVVQHECDHLIGRLYPTRMKDFTQFGFTDILFPELSGARASDDDCDHAWGASGSSSSVSMSIWARLCCSAAPSTRNVSSTRSPKVLTLAICTLSLYFASTRVTE